MNNVTYTGEGAVAVVEIDRPHRRNAVDKPTAAALIDAFERFEADDAASVAVLHGSQGAFCAGADLQALADGDGNRVSAEGAGPMGPTRMRLTKPVIAAIEGHAVAGGAELALWCDLRVMADDAVFGIFCRRFGVPLVDLGTVRLPRLIGHSQAMDLILTGRPVVAEEALRIGLANRVVAPGTARAAAVALAAEIAGFPQQCMRNDRMSTIEQWELNDDDAMRNEIRHGLDTIGSGESNAGAGRFSAGSGRHGSFDSPERDGEEQ